MRLISADRAPTDLAVSRQVAVTAATSLMIARACASVTEEGDKLLRTPVAGSFQLFEGDAKLVGKSELLRHEPLPLRTL